MMSCTDIRSSQGPHHLKIVFVHASYTSLAATALPLPHSCLGGGQDPDNWLPPCFTSPATPRKQHYYCNGGPGESHPTGPTSHLGVHHNAADQAHTYTPPPSGALALHSFISLTAALLLTRTMSLSLHFSAEAHPEAFRCHELVTAADHSGGQL